MNELLLSHRISANSPSVVKIDKHESAPLPFMGWLLAALPIAASLVCLVASFVLHVWILAAVLTVLVGVFGSFFFSVVTIHLRSISRLTITRQGITEEHRLLSGRKFRKLDIDDIKSIRASVQGKRDICLVADLHSGRSYHLLSTDIEQFTTFAPLIAVTLNKPFEFTFHCPTSSLREYDGNFDRAFLVQLDPQHHQVIMHALGDRPKAVPFDDIVSVYVIGDKVSCDNWRQSSTQINEYVYQPVIEFADGTRQQLHRFISGEATEGNTSDAQIAANSIKDLIERCITLELGHGFLAECLKA